MVAATNPWRPAWRGVRERYEHDLAQRRVIAALALQRGHAGLADEMIQSVLAHRNVLGDQGRLDRREGRTR